MIINYRISELFEDFFKLEPSMMILQSLFTVFKILSDNNMYRITFSYRSYDFKAIKMIMALIPCISSLNSQVLLYV